MTSTAVIYSKVHCPYCTRAKALLTKLDITYEEHIIGEPGSRVLEKNQSWATREELLAKAPDAKTVPQIWVDGEHVGGYTEFAARYPTQ
jgi:glutaredoxin 3